jgi:hypothetical protein
MQFPRFAMGPLLAGCALVALGSCTTEDQESEPGLGPNMSPSVSAVSTYDLIKVPAMTIDGNLAEWANIPAISMADQSGRTGGLDNTAQVKMAWDDTYLYAAYDVTDSELLALQTTRDHAQLYQDDEIELYIDPQGDGASATSMTATDYQFLANVRDAVGDKRGDGIGGKDDTFNAPSFLAKTVTSGTLNASGTDTGYKLELRISWADLGVTAAPGHFMRLDPAVGDRDGTDGVTHEFDWAGLTATFNNPSGWNDVQLVDRPPPVSAYDIVKVSAAPTIDGSLADWAGVPAISLADGSGGSTNTAKVKLVWDPTYLYFSYNVTDTELLAVQTARDHAEIYQDDEVELYIDPQGDGWAAPKMTPSDYQFLANVRDAVGDMNGTVAGGKDAAFNAPSFLAKAAINGTLNASGTDVGYTVEARISWSDLGVTPAAGNFLRIDPAVNDRDNISNPTTESFDWTGLTTNWNNPLSWKDVKLAVDNTAPAAPTNLVLAVVSSSQIDVSWTASSGTDVAKYNIYRSTTGTPSLYKTVSAGPYHDTGLTSGTSYTYQIAAVDAAGNESSKTPAKSATPSGGGSGTGIPFGPMGLWSDSYYNPNEPVGVFTMSMQSDGPSGIVTRIDSARARSHKLVLMLTSGGHTLYLTDPARPTFACPNNGAPGCRFDLEKWKDRVDLFNTTAIKTAVANAVADGTVLGYDMLDEPQHSSWGGVITKAMMDAMAAYSKAIFPTLPAGMSVRFDYRANERWGLLDFVVTQYVASHNSVTAWRDAALQGAALNGVAVVFSINILNGGAGFGETVCPNPPTGGTGYSAGRCKTGSAQLEEWGLALGPAGSGLLMWAWDSTYMSVPANDSAFARIAADLANRPTKSWRRP